MKAYKTFMMILTISIYYGLYEGTLKTYWYTLAEVTLASGGRGIIW